MALDISDIPTLLVIAGIVFLFVAIVRNISGTVATTIDRKSATILGISGVILLTLGLITAYTGTFLPFDTTPPTSAPYIRENVSPSLTYLTKRTPAGSEIIRLEQRVEDIYIEIIITEDDKKMERYPFSIPSPPPTITEVPEPTPSPIPTETPIPTPTPTVTITDPKAGDYVPWLYTVKGTSNIEPNSDLNIYVFIYAWDWYAQPKAIISSNGNWETRDRCRFGNPEHGGLDYTFDICAIAITKDFEVDEQFANLPDYKAKSEIIGVMRE